MSPSSQEGGPLESAPGECPWASVLERCFNKHSKALLRGQQALCVLKALKRSSHLLLTRSYDRGDDYLLHFTDEKSKAQSG